MTRVIDVSGMEVRLGGKKILSSVDFHAERGEFVSVVGKSGSGKTTFLNALAGFLNYKGKVSIAKNPGFVFQEYSLFPWLTAKDNIGFGIYHKSRDQREKIVSHYLGLIELEPHAGKYPAELSGGQRQRVAIARAFAPSPETVLMDEPFGALDIYSRDRMQKWLLGLLEQEKKTIVFVTHYIDEAIFLSDRIYVMKGGKFLDAVRVPFGRPRDESMKYTARFAQVKKKIYDAIEP